MLHALLLATSCRVAVLLATWSYLCSISAAQRLPKACLHMQDELLQPRVHCCVLLLLPCMACAALLLYAQYGGVHIAEGVIQAASGSPQTATFKKHLIRKWL
jgi:hypothetical protein